MNLKSLFASTNLIAIFFLHQFLDQYLQLSYYLKISTNTTKIKLLVLILDRQRTKES